MKQLSSKEVYSLSIAIAFSPSTAVKRSTFQRASFSSSCSSKNNSNNDNESKADETARKMHWFKTSSIQFSSIPVRIVKNEVLSAWFRYSRITRVKEGKFVREYEIWLTYVTSANFWGCFLKNGWLHNYPPPPRHYLLTCSQTTAGKPRTAVSDPPILTIWQTMCILSFFKSLLPKSWEGNFEGAE